MSEVVINNKADNYFKSDCYNIIANGQLDENPRPRYSDGTPAHTSFVTQVFREYDLSKGEFPIMTLRPQAWKSGIKEILWIYQDQSNDLSVLREKYGVKYWDEWDIGNGTIGKRYGYTIKNHYNIDEFLDGLKNDPFARRHIIDLWQVDDFDEPGLNPCAFLTMWSVRKGPKDSRYYLDMTLIQRSGDMCAASGAGGINEIQYTALMLMVAHHCGYFLGKFVHFVQNEQIYTRHLSNALLMTERNSIYQPCLIFNPKGNTFREFTIDDFSIPYYEMVKDKNPQLKFDLGI